MRYTMINGLLYREGYTPEDLEVRAEGRANETEKDYQREIDWLLKEVQTCLYHAEKNKELAKDYYEEAERYYKEGTQKGFKLKIKKFDIRGESEDCELRALETQKDYQNKIESMRGDAYKLWISALAEVERSYDKLKTLVKDMEKIKSEAVGKGHKIDDEPIESAKLWLKACDKGLRL